MLLAAWTSAARAQTTAPDLMESTSIKGCDLVADQFWFGEDRPREIWLRTASNSGRNVLLVTFERNAELIVSSDCRFIAMNDNLGSNIAEVRLFARVDGLIFRETKDDVTMSAWKALDRAAHIARTNLGHMYVNAVSWSNESRALLLRVWGHEDGDNYVDDWYCIYNVATHRASRAPAPFNRGVVVFDGRRRR